MATEKLQARVMTYQVLLCTAQGALMVLACAIAHASGPVGPVGPIGPIGPVGPVRSGEPPAPPQRPAPPVRAQQPTASAPQQPAQRPGAEAGGNRIEVTGNTASVTRCAGDAAASVNSVDVSGAQLEGRTVIVQGRNARDVRTQDCTDRPHASPSASSPHAPSQTNSVRIR